MNCAVIDVGSNTMRLVVYHYEGGTLSSIFSPKEMAGLAGYVQDKQMTLEGISRACDILRTFREIAIHFVEEADIHVLATAALRNIRNQKQVLEAILLSTRLSPWVLTGEEEAYLTFVGASHFAHYDDGILIDIGGASTELVRFADGQPKDLASLPMGCLTLYTRFVGKMTPTNKEGIKIKKEIVKQLEKAVRWKPKKKTPLLIGVGGTVRAAHSLACDLFQLSPSQLEMQAAYIPEILSMLKRSESEVYHSIYRQIPERAQTISTGLMILGETLRYFGCDTLFVSGFGVREGYLMDRVLKKEAVHVD